MSNDQPNSFNRVVQDPLVLICANLRMAAASLQFVLKQASDDETAELSNNVSNVLEQLDSMISKRKPLLASSLLIAEVVARPKLIAESKRITYCSSAMHSLVQMAERVANYDATVLITGETGVGKELIARLIHFTSPRHSAPLTALNCAAVPKELFESQLFGHKQGAFTGANRDQLGIIRASARGTLMLDEIGEMSLELQPKLLRFLQESEIHTVGETHPSRVNVRTIALTNRNLELEVAAGRFRADLFYRLNIVSLDVPPLRDRREDIPLLISFFIDKNANQYEAIRFSPEALECMTTYGWPGNVRELSNVILRLGTFADASRLISMADLPMAILHPILGQAQADGSSNIDTAGNGLGRKGIEQHGDAQELIAMIGLPLPSDITLAGAVDRLERKSVNEALRQHNWNFAKAARDLGLSTFGLRKKYRRLSESADEKSDHQSGQSRKSESYRPTLLEGTN
jgi:transcriptional regulator with GAF, ATPase, and Fis domain